MAGPTPLLGTLERCTLWLPYIIRIGLPNKFGCVHFSDMTMKRLLENMFCSDTPSDVVIISGVSVLLTMIEKRFDY